MAQRIEILNSIGVRARRKVENVLEVTEGIQDMLLNLVSESIEEKKFSLATRYLAILNNQQQTLSKENKVNVSNFLCTFVCVSGSMCLVGYMHHLHVE